MSQFIIEEFKKYKVFLYGSKVNDNAEYAIQIKIPSGSAYLKFCKGKLKKHTARKKGDKYVFHTYFSADKYPAFIDLFRNEKPLFFYFHLKTKACYITTTDEPVGEGE